MTLSELVSTPVAAEYQAALEGVVWYNASTGGRLRLTERDRADLLHRLSTNDTRSLTPGNGLRTVLVNHNARIIDVLTVYALPEHLLVTTSPGQHAAVINLLRRNIFFQDRVGVEDLTETTVGLSSVWTTSGGVCSRNSRRSMRPTGHCIIFRRLEIAEHRAGWHARCRSAVPGLLCLDASRTARRIEAALADVPTTERGDLRCATG